MNARRPHRIDPWHELQFTAHAALRGGSPAAVKHAADKVKFVPPVGRDFVALLNALKALGYAWPHAAADIEPLIRQGVEAVLGAIELCPTEQKLTYLGAIELNNPNRRAS